MGNTHVTSVMITGSAKPNPVTNLRPFALFGPDGLPLTVPKKMPAQANSTATDVPGLVTDFNALLTKLRNAGLLT
jgi:hypothetical protein